MRLAITGGAGFIGSALVRKIIKETTHTVLNIDKLTYAGNLRSLEDCIHSSRYQFANIDICNLQELIGVIDQFRPDAVFHLAAESHVDRSIGNPALFLQTNVMGSYNILQACHNYLKSTDKSKDSFRLIHISTDEVFGSLGKDGAFTEQSPYLPNSPYAASKAASNHLARAWFNTFNLPVIVSNCSNNYGPYQFPEKFIPTLILNAILGKPLPIYGNGRNVRDWLHVEDHVEALLTILAHGRPGEVYNIGGFYECCNLDLAQMICNLVDTLEIEKLPQVKIMFVPDRPGHDFRYAIDSTKIQKELGWKPKMSFTNGLIETFSWYLKNRTWWEKIIKLSFIGDRLGLQHTL